jgi:hypothetical protein
MAEKPEGKWGNSQYSDIFDISPKIGRKKGTEKNARLGNKYGQTQTDE